MNKTKATYIHTSLEGINSSFTNFYLKAHLYPIGKFFSVCDDVASQQESIQTELVTSCTEGNVFPMHIGLKKGENETPKTPFICRLLNC